MLGLQRNAVRLEPFDEQWALLFQEIKAENAEILGPNAMDIQHIGSTAIKGIVAKPILDVAVVVGNLDAIDIEEMEKHGYVFGGEAGIPGRCFFAKYRDGNVATHHIHCYRSENRNLLANIVFREYLNAHGDIATQYHDLKLRLAKQYPDDRARYTEEKTEFVEKF